MQKLTPRDLTDLFGVFMKPHSFTPDPTRPSSINNGDVPRRGRRQRCRSITYRWTLAQEIEQRTRKNHFYGKGQWSSSFCHFLWDRALLTSQTLPSRIIIGGIESAFVCATSNVLHPRIVWVSGADRTLESAAHC